MLAVAFLFLAQSQDAAFLAQVRQLAYVRVSTAQTVAADPEIIRAVLAKNASGETLEAIHAKDARWVADRHFPLRAELTSGACARRLRELTVTDTQIVEAMVMDRRGALVCATVETSDYWQGDEAKWQKTFDAGSPSFVDEPSLDASTGMYAVQLSVLVKDGEKKVGALTFTLKLRPTGSPGASAAGH